AAHAVRQTFGERPDSLRFALERGQSGALLQASRPRWSLVVLCAGDRRRSAPPRRATRRSHATFVSTRVRRGQSANLFHDQRSPERHFGRRADRALSLLIIVGIG